jgi:hypothetical protein
MPSTVMWRRVDVGGTDASENRIPSIFKAKRINELGKLAIHRI